MHKASESSSSKNVHEESYFRYEMKGHWIHTYLTTKYLVDFYQKSIKEKRKVETNFADYHSTIDVTIWMSPISLPIQMRILTI